LRTPPPPRRAPAPDGQTAGAAYADAPPAPHEPTELPAILGRFRFAAGHFRDEDGAPVDVELLHTTSPAHVDELHAIVRIEGGLGPPFPPVLAFGPTDAESFAIVTPGGATDLGFLAARRAAPTHVAVRVGQQCLLGAQIVEDAMQTAPSLARAYSLVDHLQLGPRGAVLRQPLRRPGDVTSGSRPPLRFHLMAPEVVRGDDVTSACDQFAIACVLVELVTGVRAFVAETSFSTLELVRVATPHPPLAARGIDPQLLAVIERMLARDAAARFPTLADAADALAPLAGDDDDVARWLRDDT
jgi:hypothetical protein